MPSEIITFPFDNFALHALGDMYGDTQVTVRTNRALCRGCFAQTVMPL
jgi:hypothetical protein